MTQTHIPVLAGELIELMDPRPGETAVDCTFGGGGHARLMADRIGPAGTLIAIDRDPAAEELPPPRPDVLNQIPVSSQS